MGPIGGTIFLVFYLISFINVLRILYLCSRTEPGIIPKVKSKKIDPHGNYHVKYKSAEKIMEDFQVEFE